jgi:hypothetical protein
MLPFQATFLAEDTLSDDAHLPEDEIDELFGKLKPIEPPPYLIQRILDAVAKLPPPSQNQPSTLEDKNERADHLIVRNEDRPAS